MKPGNSRYTGYTSLYSPKALNKAKHHDESKKPKGLTPTAPRFSKRGLHVKPLEPALKNFLHALAELLSGKHKVTVDQFLKLILMTSQCFQSAEAMPTTPPEPFHPQTSLRNDLTPITLTPEQFKNILIKIRRYQT